MVTTNVRRVDVLRALSDRGVNIVATGTANAIPGVMVSDRRGRCYVYTHEGIWRGSERGMEIGKELAVQASRALLAAGYTVTQEDRLFGGLIVEKEE
jgi:hypothetical protein